MPRWPARTPLERFLEKIEVVESGCWEWTAGKGRRGYGRFSPGRTHICAHRYSYMVFKGAIPSGLELDHLCRNPPCVNPDHLEPVTHLENVRRARDVIAASNWMRTRTHCKNGHEFTPENTGTRPGGYRLCKTCRRLVNVTASKKQKQKEKAR